MGMLQTGQIAAMVRVLQIVHSLATLPGFTLLVLTAEEY